MNEIERVQSLITGLQRTQPRIYEAFSAVVRAMNILDTDLERIKAEIEAVPIRGLPIAPNVLIFTYEFTNRNVILRWEQPDLSIFQYEIRKGGNSWETSSHLLQTATLSAVFDPLPVGTTRYWIKGIDFDGNVSETALPLDVSVPAIGSITITGTVIDNNVLLSWSIPTTTFDIAYYEVFRDTTPVGRQDGTFAIIFETVSGTYLYRVRPVDWAGNIGPEASVSVQVRQPPDFDLISTGIDDLTGVRVNTIIYRNKLLANVYESHTWLQHFEINGWTTIQQQIDATYPIYIQPTPLVGTYEKIFDFGGVFNDVIVNLSWNQTTLAGTMNVASAISTSTDGITYTTPVNGRSLFSGSLRYVKVKMTFTGTTPHALLEWYNLIVALNVKSEIDGGQIYADKDDVGGTVVVFNKAFKDINSITVDADSIEPLYIIYDFIDIPNPTQFKVLCYDSSGQRVDYLISWKARGIT
jgi:hypothetical protein